MSDLNYFFKKASKSVRKLDRFTKKNKKLFEEYEEYEEAVRQDKFVLAELAQDDKEIAKKLNLKKTRVVMEDGTIEVRAGRGRVVVINKSIYGKTEKPKK